MTPSFPWSSPFFIAGNKLTYLPKILLGHLYDEFIRLLFLDTHREVSSLTNELPEESDQFRFLRASCFTNLKGTVGLIMVQDRP